MTPRQRRVDVAFGVPVLLLVLNIPAWVNMLAGAH